MAELAVTSSEPPRAQILWEEEIAKLGVVAPSLPPVVRDLLRATLESIVSEQSRDEALVTAAAPLRAQLA